jgi:predicted nucleic acid-binding protein
MAKVFLDTNYFIGLANRTPQTDTKILNQQQGFISILSCHILFYVNKIKVPDKKSSSFIDDFNLIDLSRNILAKALEGPTPDLEDNIQLHSAASADCDIFLTSDKRLLNLKFFGKVQIVSRINS